MPLSSAQQSNLAGFLKILTDFQHDLVKWVLPRTTGRPLTLPQYLLLGVLREIKKPVTLTEISSLMNTTFPYVKALVNRLISMGAINRSTTSRNYYITRAGLKDYDAVHKQHSALIGALLLRLTEEERAMGITIYEKIMRQSLQEKLPSKVLKNPEAIELVAS